jgi:hypothetical protein
MEHERREALEEKFWAVLSEYFGYSQSNVIQAMKKTANELETLNKNLIGASQSSEKLAKALNRLTLAGVIVGAIAVGVEIVKITLAR